MKTKPNRRTERAVVPDAAGIRERRKARRLPEDACTTCATLMLPRRGTLSLPVNGEPTPVRDVPHLHCPACGENVLTMEEVGILEAGALALYRSRHHLLTADEIRALREQLGVTQAALAKLLRLGANTVSRWEAGRTVQAAALDVLLRLLRDVPGTLAYLKRHAA
jgi:putative transcriptional regulator